MPAAEAPILVLSMVSGGPMDRLADALSRRGIATEVYASFDNRQWRERMTRGFISRQWGRLSAMFFYPLRACLAIRRRGCSQIISTSNPFILPPLMLALRPLHRARVVILQYDLFPDAIEALRPEKKNSIASRVMAGLNRYAYRRAGAVTFIGESMARRAIERYGAPRRWAVIPTGASVREFECLARTEDADADRKDDQDDLERWCRSRAVVNYVGNLGAMHDWRTFAGALRRLLDNPPDCPWGIVVAAFGANGKRLREAFSGADPEFIRFEPPLEDAPWARLLVNSRASLVTLRPEAGHVSFPSKALSAMAAGNAILAVAPPDCDLSMLIKRHDCGWVIEPDDIDTLESTLRLVLTQPQRMAPFRQRAREAVREFYDLDVLAEKWERLILAPPA